MVNVCHVPTAQMCQGCGGWEGSSFLRVCTQTRIKFLARPPAPVVRVLTVDLEYRGGVGHKSCSSTVPSFATGSRRQLPGFTPLATVSAKVLFVPQMCITHYQTLHIWLMLRRVRVF